MKFFGEGSAREERGEQWTRREEPWRAGEKRDCVLFGRGRETCAQRGRALGGEVGRPAPSASVLFGRGRGTCAQRERAFWARSGDLRPARACFLGEVGRPAPSASVLFGRGRETYAQRERAFWARSGDLRPARACFGVRGRETYAQRERGQGRGTYANRRFGRFGVSLRLDPDTSTRTGWAEKVWTMG